MTDRPPDPAGFSIPPITVTVATPTCSTCRFWFAAKPGSGDAVEGECRHSPPQAVVMMVQTPLGQGQAPVPVFPRTRAEIWCGQYKSRLPSATTITHQIGTGQT